MKVEKLRLDQRKKSPQGFKTLCTFNLELTEDAKIYDLQLVQGPDGERFIVPPKSPNGTPMCSFSPRLRKAITQLANDGMTGAFAENMGTWFHKNYSA